MMAGLKFAITPKNELLIYSYFKEGFKDLRRFEEMKPADRYSAEKDLNKLYEKHHETHEAKKGSADFSSALQKWADAYIPEIIWRRALSAFRQKQHKRKNKIKNFSIKKETYEAIWFYAREVKMSMRQAIHELVKREHQKLIDQSVRESWKKREAQQAKLKD